MVRQAHTIREQRDAIGRHRARLATARGEMARREERAAERAREISQLQDHHEAATEQRVQAQHLLQESVEDMMDLKAGTERDLESIRELQSRLRQKEATLDRLTKDKGEAYARTCALEQELESRTVEAKTLDKKMEASEAVTEEARKELESKRRELEDLRRDNAAGGPDVRIGDGAGRDARAAEPRCATRTTSSRRSAMPWLGTKQPSRISDP